MHTVMFSGNCHPCAARRRTGFAAEHDSIMVAFLAERQIQFLNVGHYLPPPNRKRQVKSVHVIFRLASLIRAARMALRRSKGGTRLRMTSLTFIVADDHPLFRKALRQTVETAFDTAMIVEAGSLDEVTAAVADHRDDVDLVLFDLNMPGVRGFSGLIYLRAQYPETPVCIISASEDPATIRNAMALGASGFVPKSGSTDQIKSAIEAILAGDAWLPENMDLGSGQDEDVELARRLSSLTPQQVRVLMMLSEGLLNKQIAYQLGVSEATVKAHVSAILQKLQVENRTKAVLVAGRIEAGQWGGAGR